MGGGGGGGGGSVAERISNQLDGFRLLSKSRVCSKLTSIWLKSRVWYRVSSKSSVPSFEYRVPTKSSATSGGSHRVLPRLEYRVLSTESSAPSFGSNRVLPRLKHRVLTKSCIECMFFRVDNYRVLLRFLPRNGERSKIRQTTSTSDDINVFS